MSEKISTSKLVDGYKKAFIDSSVEANSEYSPQFLTNTNGCKVLTTIEKELKDCDEMFMSVAFITRGGVTPLLQTLKDLESKGVKGRILTTDYLLFSDPWALDTINKLKNIELKMFKTADDGTGFHTKGYMFYNDGDLRIVVGSSNLTQNALCKNHEWNTRIVSTTEGQYAKDIEGEFNTLWDSSVCYDAYRDEYVSSYNAKIQERDHLNRLCHSLDLSYSKVILPNEMQKSFIYNIEQLIEQGQTRALLISATGTGKTYASALAARDIFSKSLLSNKKILFLSHREQINKQAQSSYQRIFGKGVRMELLSGNYNDIATAKSADFLFSTMQMMAKDEVRQHFDPKEFSLIILDECHRSGAASYQKIIDYFRPDLLLGMSASPERTDDFDVYSQFNHNIACEIRLQEALENNLLCPFHYFGISDFEVEEEVSNFRDFNLLVSEKRVQYIIDKAEYFGHSGEYVKGLIFCSRKEEAKELSQKFNETGKYRTISLSGDDQQETRVAAIDRLVSDDPATRLDYIFTVDIFNEGVDIPEINQVILLRPTESPIIFVQQLGRGLRKAQGKEYVVVLDFIGNYANNYMIPIALTGDRTGNKDNIRRGLLEGNNLIQGASTIHFDPITKQRIFASIDSARLNTSKLLKQEYQNLKYKLGRIPTLKDFDKYGELDPLRIIDNRGSYYNFLVDFEDDFTGDLDDIQTEMLEFISRKFASGKRPHELELLKLLVNGNNTPIADWKQLMRDKYQQEISDHCMENVANVLTNVFYGIGSAKKTFKNCVFLSENNSVSEAFAEKLESDSFRFQLLEVIEFGLSRNKRDYWQTDGNSAFVMNKKYTYDDVCRLLNWRQNQVATNIGGYKYDETTKTYPIFINYQKDDEISETIKYEDRFNDPSSLIAISKSKRKVSSPDVQNALNSVERGIMMPLFVRKNKDDKESKEFYYLGRIRPTGMAQEFQMPNTEATAVEIGYKLEHPVDQNLYEYLTDSQL